MQEVDVFFRPAGVEVDPPLAGIHSGDSIVWKFHSVNPRVQWAEVWFEEADATFFDDRGATPPQRKPTRRRYTMLTRGHAHVVGTAPEVKKEPFSRLDKYWVRGYATKEDAEKRQNHVAERDPEIITCDP